MQKPSFIQKLLSLSTLLPIVATAATTQSYQPPRFTDEARLAKIQSILPKINEIYKNYAEKNHFPGYAYGLIVDDKLIYASGGGFANIDKKIPATPTSVFRIASMTKSFTAMAILKLRDEGKLKLDDPVSLYIPEFKDQQLTKDAAPITIRDLLTHSSGLPQDDPWGDRQLDTKDKDLLALLKQGVSFSNAPGTHYEYSNLAFSMLGYIITKVSGQPYQQYITKNIWQPLHMQNAEWEYTHVPAEALVYGYKWDETHWVEQPMLHDGTFGAMGGMMSSVQDFSLYLATHLMAWPPRNDAEAGPIKRSSIREMHQPWRFAELTPRYEFPDGSSSVITSGYGYGLSSQRDEKGRMYVGHSGGLPGFGSNWTIMPEYGVGVVLFANATYAPAEIVNFTVLNTLVKEADLQPRQLPVSEVLREKQKALIAILPDWNKAEESGLFAGNFFLDHSKENLQKESTALLKNAGKILRVREMKPENQLRGQFLLEGEKGDIQISFTLSPQNPPLIQSITMVATPKPS